MPTYALNKKNTNSISCVSMPFLKKSTKKLNKFFHCDSDSTYKLIYSPILNPLKSNADTDPIKSDLQLPFC